VFVFYLGGEIIRYEVLVMDENTGMAAEGAHVVA
jgi:hypothetical protein